MSDRPNLVFAFADQLRLQACGYAGGYADDPPPHTPNLDRLAAESVDFRQAVAVNPICCPYRASLVTGKYPSSTGMVINELRVMPNPDGIGHVLRDHGYRTAYLGKWHLYGKDHSPRQQFVPPGPYRQGIDETRRFRIRRTMRTATRATGIRSGTSSGGRRNGNPTDFASAGSTPPKRPASTGRSGGRHDFRLHLRLQQSLKNHVY